MKLKGHLHYRKKNGTDPLKSGTVPIHFATLQKLWVHLHTNDASFKLVSMVRSHSMNLDLPQHIQCFQLILRKTLL